MSRKELDLFSGWVSLVPKIRCMAPEESRFWSQGVSHSVSLQERASDWVEKSAHRMACLARNPKGSSPVACSFQGGPSLASQHGSVPPSSEHVSRQMKKVQGRESQPGIR